VWCGVLAALLGPVCAGLAAEPERVGAPEPGPRPLSLNAAVCLALERNPELAAMRQERGIAAAQVVIAETYPFNPSWENRVQQASGPFSATITNFVPLDQLVLLELEVRGQGTYRRQGAYQALTRTEWEIAFHEQTFAVRAIRAFSNLLYRQEKLRLAERTIRLNQGLYDATKPLRDAMKLTAADQLVLESEIAAARAAVGGARTSFETSRSDLRRALGVPDLAFEPVGSLETSSIPTDGSTLTLVAFQRRADLRAHQAAVAEAEAHLQLEIANRYGNPSFGPAFSYDPTRVSSIGAQVNIPLAVFNTHRGEIQQREAERTRAVLELRQTEEFVRLDVDAALVRLRIAQERVETFRDRILPTLRKGLDNVRRLFLAGQGGADVPRMLTLQRNELLAEDTYLDSLSELADARADLVAAVGDLSLAGIACPEPQAAATEPQAVATEPQALAGAAPSEDVETLPALKP